MTRMEEMIEAQDTWLKLLGCCPRVATASDCKGGMGCIQPVDGCTCYECDAWRQANEALEHLRSLSL